MNKRTDEALTRLVIFAGALLIGAVLGELNMGWHLLRDPEIAKHSQHYTQPKTEINDPAYPSRLLVKIPVDQPPEDARKNEYRESH